MNKRCSKTTCLYAFYTSLLLTGLLWLFFWGKIYTLIINTYFILAPNNTVYDIWKKNPFPLTIDFYFHNWTNPEDIYNLTTKPRFNQMGPYRFTETKEKVNITWNDHNNTVTFKHLKYWYFDPEKSSGGLDDLVTTVDPVFLSTAYQMRHWNYFLKTGFSAFNRDPVAVTKNVGQLLFEGYEDRLINIGRKVPLLSIVSIPDFDKFGWFYKRNGSTSFDGVFNMATGAGGNTLGELLSWNYDSRTSFNEGECGEIRGSAGELFPSNTRKTKIEFFSPDMCRSVKLDYTQDVRIHNILGYKFAAGPSLLDNGTQIPENLCFCGGSCVPSGAINVSACRYGSPAFVSLPHFYGADPYYVASLEGLEPNKSKHDFFIVLEPTTGTALNVAARLQLNLLLQPVSYIRSFERVPKVFIPVLWFEQLVQMPENMAFQLKILLNLPMIFIGTGCLVVTVSLVMLLVQVVYGLITKKTNEKGKNYTLNISQSEQMPLNLSKCSSSDNSKCD